MASPTPPNSPNGSNGKPRDPSLRIAPLAGEVGRVPPSALKRRQRELDEDPSEDDVARFSNVTQKCPACKKEIYDDTDVCYHCGELISRARRGGGRPPTWVIVTIVLVVLAFLFPVVWSVVR